MNNTVCPIDKAPLAEGVCPTCHREWEVKTICGEQFFASKPRTVQIVAPLVVGAKIDDCIKEV